MNVRAAAPEDGVRTLRELATALRNQLQSMTVLGVMAAVFIVTGLHSHLFWGTDNIRVLAMNASFVMLAGVGTAILVISGNIDLSIGSMLGLCAVMAAIFANHMPVPLAFLLAIVFGGLLGLINGLIVWNVSTSPIIITLGGLTLLRGVIYVATSGQAITGMPASFVDFGNSEPLGVPTPVWIAVGFVLLGFVFLATTTTGRHLYAIGGNKEATRAAGIRIRRVVIGAFLVNGLIIGLVGVLQASFYGAPDPTFGNGFELQVITAVIVGGVSFAGGEGGVMRAALGALLLETVSGSVVSFGIDPNYANIITGSILIAAVSADQIIHRQRERYRRAMAVRERARIVEEQRGRQAPGDAGPA
ncbi:MAG TPA: ABC transporter permease [Gaiellales bacterium]|jgi:ribose/xylose/arabinose/galactoside ABC-type transport system permease subunit